jgi:hypothetical protein
VPHAAPSCTGSACAVGTCNAGFADCDSDHALNGCERDLGTAFDTCATAIALADSGGATTLCGSKNPAATVAVTTYGTSYYKITLNQCKAGGCGAGDMRAKFTVQSPTGMAFDLRVFSDSACGTLVASSTSGVAGGTEVANWVGTAADCKLTTLYAQVKYRSGTGCGNASLTVNTVY